MAHFTSTFIRPHRTHSIRLGFTLCVCALAMHVSRAKLLNGSKFHLGYGLIGAQGTIRWAQVPRWEGHFLGTYWGMPRHSCSRYTQCCSQWGSMWPFASIVIVINYRITVVLSTSAEITKTSFVNQTCCDSVKCL